MSSSFYSGSGLTSTEQDSIESAIAAAQTAQSGAETAKTASETAKTGAETAETNAETAQAAAEAAKVSAEAARDTANSSSSSASTSAATATTQASTATTQASTATTKAAEAATSATAASTSESNASTSATNAASSATTATTKASEASTSASNSASSATAAASSATTATTKASEASTSASNASTSATNAASSATTATTKASEAASSATAAASSATSAASSVSSIGTSVSDAASSATAAATSATSASTSATSAASSLSSFQNQYLGASSSAPTQDPDGSALDLGDLYFDTTANVMKVYSASGWTNASSSVNGTSERQTYTATAGQDTFNVTYDAGFVDVWLNGAKLLAGTDFTASSGTNIVLASAAAAGDIVDILAFGTFVFTSNDHYTKSASDTRYVQVAGDTMTGDLTVNGNLNVAGTTVTIDSANAQTVDLGDNDKIRLGDGDDLQLYHDGSASYVSDTGTGGLKLMGSDFVALQSATGENYVVGGANDATTIYHNNVAKLATTSTGVDVNGSITIDSNGSVGVNASNALQFTSSSHAVLNLGGSEILRATDSGDVNIGSPSNVGYGPLQIGSTSTTTTVMQMLSSPSGTNTIHFGDGTSSSSRYRGYVHYVHSTDKMSFGTAAGDRLLIDSRNIGVNTNSPVDFGSNFRNINLNGPKGGAVNFTRGTNSATRQWDIYTSDADQLIFYKGGTTDAMVLNAAGHLGLGTNSPTDSAWGHSTYGNMEMTINSDGGYAVLTMTGDGAGGTSRTFTQGVGDSKFYMAYDKQASAHRIVVDSSGNVGFNNASPARRIQVSAGGMSAAARFDRSTDSSQRGIIEFLSASSGSTVGEIKITSTTAHYTSASDYRLKENVVDLTGATERLKQLKPKRFNFIADADTTIDGFLAHEAQAVVPEAVSGEKDAMTEEVLYVDGDEIPEGKKVGDVKTASKIDPQGIDQSKIVPLLVATIKELEARITALEAN